jgi:hypothetical protein
LIRNINNARYTMWATVIPKFAAGAPTDGTVKGQYVRKQDDITGAVTTEFVADSNQSTSNSPTAQYEIRCYARGYTDLGYRSSGNREVYIKGQYNIMDAIQFDFPADVDLSLQSLVTNIRTAPDPRDDKYLLWVDTATGKPVVWQVQGVTPVYDPFGKLLRNTTVLLRSEIQ